MSQFPKPNIFVSKCLGFAMCRYNGQTIQDDFVDKLKNYVNFTNACPEVEIGLGVPRFPIRIIFVDNGQRLIQPETGLDVTEKMSAFADKLLYPLTELDGFILKERSPSCGIKGIKIYHQNGMTLKGNGVGIFAAKVLEEFPSIVVEEEGRLKNFKIREYFLTRIYVSAKFRNIKKTQKMKALTEFHAENKFLLMAYNQIEMRILGKIAANLEKYDIKKVFNDYEEHLKSAFKKQPGRASIINSLQHIMGFFKDSSTANEKKFFLESLDLYKEERIPLSSLISMLRLWVARSGNEYLLKQSIFEPFPMELTELKDSGKKLDL